MSLIQLSDARASQAGSRHRAILVAGKFTRLAQVTGDADCDRPLTFSSDV